MKKTITAALAALLTTGLSGSAMAGTIYPTSTDEARAAAGQAQHSVSRERTLSHAPTGPATSSDEAWAAAGRNQHRVAPPRVVAERGGVVTTLDETRGTAAPSAVEPRSLEPADLGLRGAATRPGSLETQAR